MKSWIFYVTLLLLVACKGEETLTYLTPEKASIYFKSIEDICNKDNGELWGENLYGPIMLIDRVTRNIVANQPDKDGLLKGKDGYYTGLFPKELIINNAPVSYGGTLFAMAPLPSQDDEYRIKTRAIRSLYHRFKQTHGFIRSSYDTNNMDEKEARLWLKLEWKALSAALTSEGEEREVAIRDALIFKGANRELYHKFVADENRFESFEGLATFTYTLLCADSPDELNPRLIENLNRIYSMQSYSRSYGYIHGALYASLLYDKGYLFKNIKSDTIDLANAVKEAYNINLPAICRDVAGSLAVSYNVEKIYAEEAERLADMQERIHKQISTFTDKPVVFIELESPYFDFEPEDVQPLDTLGTLYSALRVSDNWGKLTVDKGGCLVSSNYKYIRITARGFNEDRNHYSGEGWNLIINGDWELIMVDQNYFIRKLMP